MTDDGRYSKEDFADCYLVITSIADSTGNGASFTTTLDSATPFDGLFFSSIALLMLAIHSSS